MVLGDIVEPRVTSTSPEARGCTYDVTEYPDELLSLGQTVVIIIFLSFKDNVNAEIRVLHVVYASHCSPCMLYTRATAPRARRAYTPTRNAAT